MTLSFSTIATLRGLSFLIIGRGVEEFLGQVQNFTIQKVHYIKKYLKSNLEMLEKFDTPETLLFVSFNLNLKLDGARNTVWI